jgi:aspartate aminotransferase
MSRIQGQSTGGVSPVAQAAAVAALNGHQDLVADMRTIYAARGAMVARALAALPGVRCTTPRAAFYVFPDISGLFGRTAPGGRVLNTDEDVSDALLEDALVACVHGTAFGAPGHLRISTASDDEPLREACRRIAAFCAALR